MKNLITNLKENKEDFEFYPTTNEIIKAINNLHNNGDILDIGCGNGQTLMKLKGFKNRYGIEKSEILIKRCDPEIIIIGTEFKNQTLIDKNIENIFCNPPYSEFKEWTIKILREATASKIILVIPQRWKNDEEIKDIIKKRAWSEYNVGSFDFLGGERQARAVVDVIVFSKSNYRGKSAFDLFFENTFNINQEEKPKEKIKDKIKNEVVEGDDLIRTLCRLYDVELNNVFENYRKIETLDSSLLKELGVKVDDLKDSLKMRIKGLKALYWQELFTKFNTILKRLSFKYRTELREKLSTNVDFNESNIYAVVIWVIKNANKYIDKQIVDIFYELTDEKNIINYKSNQKTWSKENFRWNNKSEINHFKLDYRIIMELCGGNFLEDGKFKYHYHSRDDNNQAKRILNDILAVAYNFGYNVDELPLNGWEYGKSKDVYYNEDELKVLMSVKIFKKGTVHIKFCQEFIKQLNIESSRILGWIKDKNSAVKEMNIKESDFDKYYKSNNIINNKLLLN